MNHRRIAVAATAFAAAVAAGTASASAGTYDVLSCAAAGGINHAWVPRLDDPPSLRSEDSCSGVIGGAEDGLFAADRIPGPPNTPAGREAGWRITAPAGTRITRLTAQYYLGQFSSGEWLPFIRTAEGALLDSCTPPGGQTTCERGQSAYDPLGPAGVFAVDTAGLEAGVRCATPSGSCGDRRDHCTPFGPRLYSTRVQITDPSPPALSTPSGALWADGYHRGIEAVSVQASDNTGIRATRLRVDGFERGAAARICDFTLVVPCTNEPGATIALDTRTISDGSHQLSVVAEDAALNATSVTRTIVVDNGAPAAPTDVTLEGAPGRQGDEQLHRSMAQPGRPGGADRCRALDAVQAVGQPGAWRPARRAPTSLGSPRCEVPGPGDWDLRIWLEDAAGNADSSRASPPLRLSLAATGCGTRPAPADHEDQPPRQPRHGRGLDRGRRRPRDA